MPPEVIAQIRRACENSDGGSSGENRASLDSATPNSIEKHPTDTETIAHRVHAILVRYLGPGSLATFFQSNTSEESTPRVPHSASSCVYGSLTESCDFSNREIDNVMFNVVFLLVHPKLGFYHENFQKHASVTFTIPAISGI
ncbi:unnamed protein product [Dibothriocephalus latus]|uniref:Uncharacterized protein n=1 Tax=Dibothriocephalus latus TaxID=60516 RepID=A0A3P7M2R8_DIBLA|nr:unnamed protein product [Dibothriocephalus latus]